MFALTDTPDIFESALATKHSLESCLNTVSVCGAPTFFMWVELSHGDVTTYYKKNMM